MKLFKLISILTIFILTACGSEEAAEQNNSVADKPNRDCSLTMGWESRAPYQFERNGEIVGIDIQVFKQAADSINCDVKFVEKPWTQLLTDLENGEVDVLAGATVTPDREEFANFSAPYRDESFTLFIRSSNSYNGNTLSGFLSRSQKVGITSDYFYGKEVYELMNHPQYSGLFIDSKSGEQSFFNILYSEIDGVLADPVEGQYILKRKRLDDKIKASNVHLPSDSVAFMFSKASIQGEQLEQLQKTIKDMVDNQKIQQMIAKF
ncbi:substrate-binding periplasmic protein [Kangiella marina]|uniref:Solute-binding protein family 3/N-terminal domain-containing protein n=1 Tax=Kangiella marina TaxID=1079178 RepID=A0ABP8IK77_9GAMM